MKHTIPPDTDVPIDTTNFPNERPPKLRSRTATRSNKFMKSMIALLCLALSVTVYVLAHRSFSKHPVPIEKSSLPTTRAVEVEVLDGAGSMRAAQHVTNVLRSQGYDVVEMKKNNNGLIERTYVIDRSGNLDVARALATELGISQDKVFQKIDRNVFLDVTVMVGTDYTRLKAFQILSERNEH
jgi:hypothetical protein